MALLYVDSNGASTNSGTSDTNSPTLSGTSEATVVANKTFVDGNVTVGTDVINVATHGFTSGSGCILTTTGTLPAGLTLFQLYYIFSVDANNITLHTNVADAEAGTNPVDITAAAGGGTHTINNMTVNISGSPDLSGVITTACRLTTTGTSHVFTMNGGVHGLTTGESCWLQQSSGATSLGGISAWNGVTATIVYYANALSSTTFRLYATKAQAVAGGASTLNITGTLPTLRSIDLRTNGNQQAVNIASSSVTNRKNFWIRAVSNTNKLLIIDDTLTLSATPSNWAIGGRVNASGLADLWNNFRFEEIVYQNTDISAASLTLSFRPGGGNYSLGFGAAGSQIWTGVGGPGVVRMTGTTGARRLLQSSSGSNQLINTSPNNSNVRMLWENMELQHQGTGSVYGSSSNHASYWINSAITDSGNTVSAAVNFANNLICMFYNTEITNCSNTVSGGSLNVGSSTFTMIKCYLHDNVNNFQWTGTGNHVMIENIFDTFSGTGMNYTGGSTLNVFPNLVMKNNTVYKSGANGFAETSALQYNKVVIIDGNIFLDNGDAATEANINLVTNPADVPSRIWIEKNNCVSIAGGRGGVNTLLYTLDSSDITTDPDFVDPDNASAALRNFNLNTGSPARGSNFPFTTPGSGTISYRDLGASQHQDSGGGGGDGQPVIGGWH